MGWQVGYDTNWRRDIGYGVPAECDHPDCTEKIDRGLGYVCGGQPFGGEHGCGLYFCGEHLGYGAADEDGNEVEGQFCERCLATGSGVPFEPKPDLQEWTDWKMTDPSWATWRAENGHPEPKPPAPEGCPDCDVPMIIEDGLWYCAECDAYHGEATTSGGAS